MLQRIQHANALNTEEKIWVLYTYSVVSPPGVLLNVIKMQLTTIVKMTRMLNRVGKVKVYFLEISVVMVT